MESDIIRLQQEVTSVFYFRDEEFRHLDRPDRACLQMSHLLTAITCPGIYVGVFLFWNGFHIDERSVNRYNHSEERRDEHDDTIHAAREEHVHVSSIADQWCTQDNRD